MSPTATATPNDAFQALYNMILPVGTVVENSDANFAVMHERMGTWEQWGQGRVVICVSDDNPDMNAAEMTGGAKTGLVSTSVAMGTSSASSAASSGASSVANTGSTTLTVAMMAAHTHPIRDANGNNQLFIFSGGTLNLQVTSSGPWLQQTTVAATSTGGTGHTHTMAHTHTIAHTHAGITHTHLSGSTMMPYFVVYRWKRTA